MTTLRIPRAAALYAIAAIITAASLVAFAQSYRGLYLRAAGHGLGGLWAALWPLQVDTFVAVGELALFVALVDRWAPVTWSPQQEAGLAAPAGRRSVLRDALSDPRYCTDCGVATSPQPPKRGTWEYYIVTRETWAVANAPVPEDMARAIRTREPHWLSVGCLEQRLGRMLTPADFQSEGWRGFWRLARPLWTDRLLSRVTGEAPPPDPRQVSPEEFAAALEAALAGSPYRPFVTQLAPAQIRATGMRPYLAAGDRAGLLIHDHGDGHTEMRSVFNRTGVRGYGHALGAWAVREHGVNYGRAFDGSQAHKGLLAHGMTEVSRVPFDPALAPPGWDAARFGTPDYLTLALPREIDHTF